MPRAPIDEHTTDIDGIEVTMRRSRVRNMTLRVSRDGRVTLTRPARTPEAEAVAFFESKRAWVEAKLARVRAEQAAGALEDGGSCHLWGERKRLFFLEEPGRKRGSVEVQGSYLVFHLPPDSTPESRERLFRAFLARELKAVLPSVAARAEERVGRCAAEWRIRSMRSRWGSCNTATGVIAIASSLAQYPPECLEEVVVHELCHLFETGHNQRFYALMDRFCPRWREARAILKRGLAAL